MKHWVRKCVTRGPDRIDPIQSELKHTQIYVYHRGLDDKPPHVRLLTSNAVAIITIAESPEILGISPEGAIEEFQDAIDYVARNHDIFLKHYQDTTFEFSDKWLFDALRARKENK